MDFVIQQVNRRNAPDLMRSRYSKANRASEWPMTVIGSSNGVTRIEGDTESVTVSSSWVR